MSDRSTGGIIVAGSIIGIIAYGALMYYAWELTLRLTAFIGVTAVLGILAWIGYTMATTPSPDPLADLPPTELPAGPTKGDDKKN